MRPTRNSKTRGASPVPLTTTCRQARPQLNRLLKQVLQRAGAHLARQPLRRPWEAWALDPTGCLGSGRWPGRAEPGPWPGLVQRQRCHRLLAVQEPSAVHPLRAVEALWEAHLRREAAVPWAVRLQ